MADLIDRAALLKKAVDAEILNGAVQVIDVDDILAVPAVDALEVVRCKDCKKRNTVNCPMEEQYVEYPWQATKHDDYCSYGEREKT